MHIMLAEYVVSPDFIYSESKVCQNGKYLKVGFYLIVVDAYSSYLDL